MAVERHRHELCGQARAASRELSYYVTSVAYHQMTDAELLAAIRDHFGAIENGSHHRRDVTYREDGCRIGKNGGAQVMAALRNVAIGLYHLQKNAEKTRLEFGRWSRRMSYGQGRRLLRGP
jgi:predicted transposase YbfD/YdcC